jgi:hypothetical protein
MAHFKEALLDELTARVQAAPDSRPAARRARGPAWRRPALAAAGALAVAAAALIIGPLTADPAYAVSKHRDGTVSLTLRELADPAHATRDLRSAGLPARVLRLSAPGGCPAPAGSGPPWQPADVRAKPGTFSFEALGGPADLDVTGYITNVELYTNDIKDLTMTFRPNAIPAGAELVIVEYPDNGGSVVTAGVVHRPGPTCWERAG